ncbi:MAG: ribosome silencing factor [Desulfobacteraceae bacterium]|nr:MAG: ribosome silencing factor [Desulfobacteraceae bacterium]
MDPLDKALLCLKIIQERKAIDPVLFDVREFTSITDYFLITSGSSNRQVQTISKHIVRRMREEGFKVYGMEGEQQGHWVLIDYNDVVIHVFYQPVREFYDLEGLWVEAPRVKPEEPSGQGERVSE